MVAIAISGKMGSGKTTLTQEVIRQLESQGFQAQQVSLGGAVKEVAHRYFNMSPDFKDRELLQKIGQQFQAIRSSVWIDLIVAQTQDPDTVYICDDVRFRNEAQSLMNEGWKSVRLQVSEAEQQRRLQVTYKNSWESHWRARHEISEVDLDGHDDMFDMIIPEISVDDVQKYATEIVDTLILNSREELV